MNLLRTRLNELEDAWLRKGMPHTRWLNPGLPAADSERSLHEAGLSAPTDILTWFSWHDGAREDIVDGVDARRAFFRPVLTLKEALFARQDSLEWAESEIAVGFPGEDVANDWGPLWADNWLPLLDSRPGMVFAELCEDTATVRVASAEPGSPASDQVWLESLGAVVETWIRVVEDYCEWDPVGGMWRYDYGSLPTDRRFRSFV